MLIEKGSVAVDGISLTVVDLGKDEFSAAVIPHTFEQTTLRAKAEGDLVNVETDMLGKWVKKLVSAYAGGAGSEGTSSALTVDRLREQGFV